MSRLKRNIIDTNTLVSRKYFSSAGRTNHGTDLHHDKANLFPNFYSFEKPACKVHNQSFTRDENSRSRSVPKAPQRVHLPSMSNKSFVRETKEAPVFSMQASMLALGERDREKHKLMELEEKRERILQDLYVPPEEKEKVEEKVKVEVEGAATQETSKPKRTREHKIVEKSKQLLQSIRSPQEIFRKLRQANLANIDQSKSGLQELEKIKSLAKRLDMNVSFEVADDLHKVGRFLKEIPIEYYQKIRKKKLSPDKSVSNGMTHNSSIFSTQIVPIERGERGGSVPSSERGSLGLGNVSARFISVADYDGGYDKAEEENRRRRKLKGSDIVSKEKSLFLSPLESYVNSFNKLPNAKKGSSTSPGGQGNRNNLRDVKGYGQYGDNVTKRTEDRIETSVWIDQISTLRSGINDYFSKKSNDKSFVNGCHKRIVRHISKLGLSKLPSKEALTKNTEEDYEKGEQNEIIGEAKNRDSKVYSILKSVLGTKTGSSSQAVKEHLEFYRKLAAKEQRRANKTLAGQAMKKSENKTSTTIGRDIFNGNNGY